MRKGQSLKWFIREVPKVLGKKKFSNIGQETGHVKNSLLTQN